MRLVLTFVLGVAVGTASTVFALRQRHVAPAPAAPDAAATTTIAAAPPPLVAESAEEELAARAGTRRSPADAPIAQAIGAEPSLKAVPPRSPPEDLTAEAIVIPVVDVRREKLRSMFHDRRGAHEHRALDIMAPRGTPVLAAIDGSVARIFLSKAGGITIYEYDATQETIYYYAHLDGYAPDLVEGQPLHRRDVIGFVGTSGNAPPHVPHLHFAIAKLTEPGRWWKSVPIDPYPLLMSRGVTVNRAAPTAPTP